MKIIILKSVSFLAGLVLLQQAIVFGSAQSTQLNLQLEMINARDIDPSALFYMESKLALNAEKSIRKQINDS